MPLLKRSTTTRWNWISNRIPRNALHEKGLHRIRSSITFGGGNPRRALPTPVSVFFNASCGGARIQSRRAVCQSKCPINLNILCIYTGKSASFVGIPSCSAISEAFVIHVHNSPTGFSNQRQQEVWGLRGWWLRWGKSFWGILQNLLLLP